MRLEYLGDALDHFKGSLLRLLTEEEQLRPDLAADPMLTDVEDWRDEHYDFYAELIGVAVGRVVRSDDALDWGNRRELGIGCGSSDLFLDPDTGIKTGSQSPLGKYVRPLEIHELCRESDRVVAIYQHAWRRGGWAQDVLDAVPDLAAAGYVSAQVAMMFFSSSDRRIERLATALAGCLGPRDDRLVRH